MPRVLYAKVFLLIDISVPSILKCARSEASSWAASDSVLDSEAEVQGGRVLCPRLRSWLVAALGAELRPLLHRAA